MTKIEAQENLKKLQVEASSLSSTALVTLFEIDLSDLGAERSISLQGDGIYRFHNCVKLINSSITFQDNIYQAAPINAEGFEIRSSGTIPTPTLTLSVIDEAIPLLSVLKNQIIALGDIIGAKVTRRRTFAKFLDSSNFNSENKPKNIETNDLIEFPLDIYHINRKIKENKTILAYELVSALDLESVMLPKRMIIAKRCNFTYRGEGCLYEYNIGSDDEIFGVNTILPEQAPPIATEEDKLIKNIIGTSIGAKMGKYKKGLFYPIGSFTYIERNGIKYYFVARRNGQLSSPPVTTDWIADKCSKCLYGCRLRWGAGTEGSVITGNSASQKKLVKGNLPFGGFPGTERLRGRGF